MSCCLQIVGLQLQSCRRSYQQYQFARRCWRDSTSARDIRHVPRSLSYSRSYTINCSSLIRINPQKPPSPSVSATCASISQKQLSRLNSSSSSTSSPPLSNSNSVESNQPKSTSKTSTVLDDSAVITDKVTELVLQLTSDLRRKQRIKQGDLRAIVDLIEKGASVGDQGTHLLNIINFYLPDVSSADKVKLSKIVWNGIEMEGKLSGESFDALLKCYTDNEFTEYNPVEFFTKFSDSLAKATSIDGRVLKPSEKSYYYTLLSCCQAGDLKNAVHVLDLVKKEDIPVDENFFHALMIGNCRANDQESAKNILGIMKASNLEPSAKTYATLMQTYLETNNSKELATIYSAMAARKLDFSEQSIFHLIRLAVIRQDQLAFNQFLSWLPSKLEQQSLHATHCIINLIHSGCPQEAVSILIKCSHAFHTPGGAIHFGGFLIRELVLANCNLSSILDACLRLEQTGHTALPINLATAFSLRYGKFVLTYQLFRIMMERKFPLRPHYFWPIFLHESTSSVQGILDILTTMKKFNVSPDGETLTEIILPKIFSMENDPLEVAKVLKDSAELSYSSGLLKAILTFLLKRGQLIEASNISRKIRGTISQPTRLLDYLLQCLLQVESREKIDETIQIVIPIIKLIFTNTPADDKLDYVGKFILKFYEAIGYGGSDMAHSLLETLRKEGIKISEDTVEALEGQRIKCNLEIDTNLTLGGFSRSYTHPKEMDIAGLECHIAELKAKELNARGAQRMLFIKYCQKADKAKVEELKTEFETSYDEGLSIGMTSSLLGFYTRNKFLQEALETFGDLKRKINTSAALAASKDIEEAFEIDLSKIVDLSALIAQNGRLQESFEFLKSECSSLLATGHSRRVKPSVRSVVSLLDSFRSSNDQETKSVLDYLLKAEIIGASAPINGVVVKQLLESGNIWGAVEVFEEYASSYKITPALIHLLYSVLQKGNEPLLERVSSSCIAIRGLIEWKHYVGFALSDLGDTTEATKVFRDLGRNRNVRRIENQAEYLAERNELGKLINLAKSISASATSKDGRNYYDCSKFYWLALKCCQRTNDPQQLALVLQAIQEADQRVPSHVIILADELNQKMLLLSEKGRTTTMTMNISPPTENPVNTKNPAKAVIT